MADAAHELRTPLTALHLQMGHAGARAASEAERADAWSSCRRACSAPSGWSSRCSSLARQEPRAARRARAGARSTTLAREVVAEMVPLADARHIDLGLGAARPRQRVRRRGSAAHAAAQPHRQRGALHARRRARGRRGRGGGSADAARAELAVSDDGPGMPPEERERVFDRFYRRAGTAPPGSGLGLAIVKAIADAHGATLTLTERSRRPGAGRGRAVPFPAARLAGCRAWRGRREGLSAPASAGSSPRSRR